jgi:hypothetical protein
MLNLLILLNALNLFLSSTATLESERFAEVATSMYANPLDPLTVPVITSQQLEEFCDINSDQVQRSTKGPEGLYVYLGVHSTHSRAAAHILKTQMKGGSTGVYGPGVYFTQDSATAAYAMAMKSAMQSPVRQRQDGPQQRIQVAGVSQLSLFLPLRVYRTLVQQPVKLVQDAVDETFVAALDRRVELGMPMPSLEAKIAEQGRATVKQRIINTSAKKSKRDWRSRKMSTIERSPLDMYRSEYGLEDHVMVVATDPQDLVTAEATISEAIASHLFIISQECDKRDFQRLVPVMAQTIGLYSPYKDQLNGRPAVNLQTMDGLEDLLARLGKKGFTAETAVGLAGLYSSLLPAIKKSRDTMTFSSFKEGLAPLYDLPMLSKEKQHAGWKTYDDVEERER